MRAGSRWTIVVALAVTTAVGAGCAGSAVEEQARRDREGDGFGTTVLMPTGSEDPDAPDADESPLSARVAGALGSATPPETTTTLEPPNLDEIDPTDDGTDDGTTDEGAIDDTTLDGDGTATAAATPPTTVRRGTAPRPAATPTPAPTPTAPAAPPTTATPPAPTTTAGWVAVSCTPLAPPPGWTPASSWVPGTTC